MLSLALIFSLSPATGAWADDAETDQSTGTTQQQSDTTDGAAIDGEGDADNTDDGAANNADDANSAEGGSSLGGEANALGGGEANALGGAGGATPLGIDDPDPNLPELSLKVTIASDGTPDATLPGGAWDTSVPAHADDNAGNDSGPNNGIVRVNDTVTYAVEYAVPSSSADNLTFTLKFPKGIEITELPGFCLASGSSIFPPTAGEPTLPLSATSIDQLNEQTLVCNRGTVASGTDVVDVTVKVLNLAHQGQTLQILEAELVGDGHNGVALDAVDRPTVTASARLMWDISKNSAALTADSGYHWGPGYTACYWDVSKVCFRTDYSLLFSGPAGGKGAMPATGDVTFVDDVSPAALYPGSAGQDRNENGVDDITDMEAALTTYGSRVRVFLGGMGSQLPYGKIDNSTATESNSVRDSGAISASQAGPGQPATITIASADWSLKTYPSTTGTGAALPGDQAFAVSGHLQLWTPVETVREFGIEDADTWTLATHNVYSGLNIQGFEATDIQTTDLEWNNYRNTTPKIELSGGFRKNFVGVPEETGNMGPTDFYPLWPVFVGPPGGAGWNSGGITVAPTQSIISNLLIGGSNPALSTDVSVVACDSWNNSMLHLKADDYPGAPINPLIGTGMGAAAQAVPSGGAAVWVSGYNNVPHVPSQTKWATTQAEVPELRVEYAATPGGSGWASECGDAAGPWFADPAQVPGNDPDRLADGIYTGVSRVRVHIVLPETNATAMVGSGGVNAWISIGMEVANDSAMETGDKLPNWASQKRLNFSDATMEEVIAAPHGWSLSTYDPASHAGALGDRLILAHAQVRIDKQVRKGDSGAFSNTPPATSGDDLVQYRLAPTLTSPAQAPGILKDVWVEDCLPDSQIYSTASIAPVTVIPGVTAASWPADAKRPACADGESYIRWVLEDHEVNTVIEPIILSVTVDPTADDGVYQNTVVVWAEDDASTLAQRSDQAEIQISNVRGIRITKQPLTPVVQINRADSDPNQRELNEWSVRFSNRLPGAAPVPNDPDIIDVLPKQGFIGSNFNGTFTFHSAEVTEGNVGAQTVRILYTRAANPSEDPRVASNGPAGSTTWCDAPTDGDVVLGSGTSADCPMEESQVTAIRVQRLGPFSSGSVIEFTIRMVGVGNRGGDVYVNRATGFATGLDNAVRSVESPEEAIESSIGDYVWWDYNRNGLQDTFQGAPERAAEGVAVLLRGVDDLGNDVVLDTATGTDGTYTFGPLRSSNGDGYTVTFVAPDGSTFTTQFANGPDGDQTNDSNADPATGVAPAVVLGRNTANPTIDAGLLADGRLVINKLLEGAGVQPFAVGNDLVFSVVCTLDGTSVFDEEVTLTVEDGDTSVDSDPLGPIPALAECTVTETSAGDADGIAPPRTVTVPHNAANPVVTASLTNYYSAGTISLTKELAGNDTALEAAAEREFEILVTCQVEEGATRSDVHSQIVTFTGGGTRQLLDANGDPVYLPLGAKCFAEELEDGGATRVVIDHDSYENGIEVLSGTPSELQQLSVSVLNEFDLPEGSLVISKLLEGVGVAPFSGKGELAFGVVCTFEGQTVFEDEITLTVVEGATSVLSDELGPLPASITCVVTETKAGWADEVADPVTVVIPWNSTEWVSGTVTASLTNYYSAGTISLTKELEGNETALKVASEREFEILVTCQVEEGEVRSEVLSQLVSFTGAGSVQLTDEDGEPVALPLGTKCFAQETDNGGASRVTIANDSFENGVEVVSGTPDELQELSITVVNAFELPQGSLAISKLLSGAGVQPFAGGDQLVFDVVCTFEGDTVYEDTITLAVVEGATSVLSGVLGPLPASSKCLVTETSAGSADAAAEPVEVTIPWDTIAWTSGTVTASLTNYYSAGNVALTKELEGDAQAVEWAKNLAFEFTVTCQIEEPGADGSSIIATLYSGNVKIKGGQRKMLVNDAGDTRALPLGARCFAVEVDDRGATSSSVDANSFATAVTVTDGKPDELQQLTINAVNTFECTPEICERLRFTGADRAGMIAAGVIGAGLLLAGAVLLVKRRREEASRSTS